MADLYFRSYNPIWDFRSLTGLPLDDTSWAYFLTNDIPYIPQNVYHTPNGIPWNNPVQLSAAGTLQNIFFDPSLVYRIEIRTNVGNLTPPSQSDALVWLIEDYVPDGSGGNTPITSATIATSNQITNPQFVDIDFTSPLSASGVGDTTIKIGDGWDLVLTGTNSNYTITRNSLTSDSNCVTNAPYSLELNLSGWDSAYLIQRMQSGTLFTSSATTTRFVTGSITARINNTPQVLSVILIDSFGVTLGNVLSGTLSTNYEEIKGVAQLPISTNTNVPPDSYVEYRIILPQSGDVSLTSAQLIGTTANVALPYEQITVERQIDQTYHNKIVSILNEPKESILVGWDFPLNPWQFTTTANTTLAGNGGYTADQTIVITENADSVGVGINDSDLKYFKITPINAVDQGRVAVIQYIDPKSCRSQWGKNLSSMVEAYRDTALTTNLEIKMQLVYSAALPTGVNIIDSWDADSPVYISGWTPILPLNDPAYTLSTSLDSFEFNQFSLSLDDAPACIAVVIYITSPMSSAESDGLVIKTVSLVQNDVALIAPPLTYDETLRRCQFYYEKSYQDGVLPGTVTQLGEIGFPAVIIAEGTQRITGRGPFTLNYITTKRSIAPTITLYAPSSATAGQFAIISLLGATILNTSVEAVSNLHQYSISQDRVTYLSNNNNDVYGTSSNAIYASFTILQYTCDARIGLIP